MTRSVIRFCNGLITFLVTVVLIVCTAYAGYALWDNQQVYNAVENATEELREIRAQMDLTPVKLKGISGLLAAQVTPEPTADPAPETQPTSLPEQTQTVAATEISQAAGTEQTPTTEAAVLSEIQVTTPAAQTEQAPAAASATATPTETAAPAEPTAEPTDDSPFGQLRAINPDITAWIIMPGTAIDYPVLQGATNMSYINTDVYGEFAMAGSIYLDSRNDREYKDIYSLLYGHNMSKHRMFSDVNLYKDEEFFKENHLGMLLMEDGGHLLQSLACILTSAGNSGIFNPENWNNSTNEQKISMVLEDAVQVDQETLDMLKNRMEAEEPYRIVALSTCSGEFTDARTILLTLMDPD